MKVAIIGGGYSGVILSILLKKQNNDIDVYIFEKENKLLKKIYATGNGRCNLGNFNDDLKFFNSIEAYSIYQKCDINKQVNILKELNIATRNIQGYLYPFSLSAKNYIENLEIWVKKLNIKVYLNHKLKSYNQNILKKYNLIFENDLNIDNFDFLIFTSGGKSTPNLGSDGIIFSVLKEHSYIISNLQPGLCPIKTLESTKEIKNERIKCKACLYDNSSNLIYSEDGEVIFKEDGLSGICIFNIESIIKNKNIKTPRIILKVFDEENGKMLKNYYIKYKNIEVLHGFFDSRMFNYIKKYYKNNFYQFEFSYKDSYSFNDSQVTIGGVSFLNINKDTLESKIEKNVYFAGEILDINGLCGGYNLMLCFSSSYIVCNNILKHL